MKTCVVIFLVLLANATTASEPLKIGITENLLNKYNTYLAGRSVYEIKEYDGNGARRSVIEVVLLLQALKAGGLNDPVEWVLQPNYARIKRSLQNGTITLSASSLWNYDIEELRQYCVASDAIVAEGEYQAGLFKLSTNPLTISNINDLPSLTAISVAAWIPDWNTLASLPLKKVIDANKWDTMIKLLIAERGDFILSSFKPTEDMGFTEGGYRFVPIKNIKVSLLGSRHFVISAQDTHHHEVLTTLNNGIKKLRAEGVINKAFTQAGFYNANVKGWQDLTQ
ncbi:hypothetical protein CW745_06730 [Psychromonas sp. psych-6C06]|uniref:hypothetical protein n=1 Tax=Psychromonas sp. psych-6C06 TaxID=2058089 RepID=UPI000C33A3BB|nr:hypothetical protein [Psychromonas sp. psych-6C06]PKF63109.1 hypothetical protein CW745_06730 [Psychromonas sp. psych-6C06]